MSYHIISYHIILCNSWAPNIFWLVSEFKLFKPISVANVPSLSPWGKHRKREDSRAYGFSVPKWICTHVCFCCFHIYDNFLQGNQQIYTTGQWLIGIFVNEKNDKLPFCLAKGMQDWSLGPPSDYPLCHQTWLASGKLRVCYGKSDFFKEVYQQIAIFSSYPLVNCHISMENHHFSWVNQRFQWPFSLFWHHQSLETPGTIERTRRGWDFPVLLSKATYLG